MGDNSCIEVRLTVVIILPGDINGMNGQSNFDDRESVMEHRIGCSSELHKTQQNVL